MQVQPGETNGLLQRASAASSASEDEHTSQVRVYASTAEPSVSTGGGGGGSGGRGVGLTDANRFELERRRSRVDGKDHPAVEGGALLDLPAWMQLTRMQSEWPMIFACLLVCAILAVVVLFGSQPADRACNYATKHAFLVVPLDAHRGCHQLLLSHGGEFQCPHQFDLKLLAAFSSGSDRRQFCQRWREEYGDIGSSVTRRPAGKTARGQFTVAPSLPEDGLRRLLRGEVAGWAADLSDDAGGQHTYMRNVGMRVVRVLHGAEYGLRERAPRLSYLLFPTSASASSGRVVAAHRVTAPPDFDHLFFGVLNDTAAVPPVAKDGLFGAGKGHVPSALDQDMAAITPKLLVLADTPNEQRRAPTPGRRYRGTVRSVDPGTGLPRHVPVELTVDAGAALYMGSNDPFVVYHRYCAAPERPKWDVCAS